MLHADLGHRVEVEISRRGKGLEEPSGLPAEARDAVGGQFLVGFGVAVVVVGQVTIEAEGDPQLRVVGHRIGDESERRLVVADEDLPVLQVEEVVRAEDGYLAAERVE